MYRISLENTRQRRGQRPFPYPYPCLYPWPRPHQYTRTARPIGTCRALYCACTTSRHRNPPRTIVLPDTPRESRSGSAAPAQKEAAGARAAWSHTFRPPRMTTLLVRRWDAEGRPRRPELRDSGSVPPSRSRRPSRLEARSTTDPDCDDCGAGILPAFCLLTVEITPPRQFSHPSSYASPTLISDDFAPLRFTP